MKPKYLFIILITLILATSVTAVAAGESASINGCKFEIPDGFEIYNQSSDVIVINNDDLDVISIYAPSQSFTADELKEELIKQWKSIRGCLPELISYINQEREYMRLSASVNWAMHEQNLIDDDRRENGDEFIESEKAIDRMIEYLKAKWEFIDQNIVHL